MEESVSRAREALMQAKSQSLRAVEAIQVAAIAQAEGAAVAVAELEKVAERQVFSEIYSDVQDLNVSNLSFDDIDFDSSQMSPPFLDPDSCLVPGEPVVRVEKAPGNARRIFAGIDIMASVDDVWKVRIYLGEEPAFRVVFRVLIHHAAGAGPYELRRPAKCRPKFGRERCFGSVQWDIVGARKV